MSARRISELKVELPPNPEYLDFPRSDGSPSVWPQNTTRVEDHEGHVNFMQPVGLDASVAKRWRIQVASAIAIDMGMAGMSITVVVYWNYAHLAGTAIFNRGF